MINNSRLADDLAQLLKINEFNDYCPNGLQIEGSQKVSKVITGVSICDELIDQAILESADTIIVHHGLFWLKDPITITGYKRSRIKKLLEHNINLYAYHLPLDNHSTLGNNIRLANLLEVEVVGQTSAQNLLWYGKLKKPVNLKDFQQLVESKLSRKSLCFGGENKIIENMAWCSGGADGLFSDAINLGVDLYLTGEVSEPIMHLSKETDVAFIAAGHYATERYGIMALTDYLQKKYDISAKFIEIYNPV